MALPDSPACTEPPAILGRMPRSQVQSLLEEAGVRRGRLLIAASGGLDSTVLLELAREVAGALRLELVVGHVNHQLRGDASDADARWLRERVEAAGLRYCERSIDPAAAREGLSSRDRPTLEEAARAGRQGALEAIATDTGCRWIATAHHADDQAETVLLRLLRGTGPEGLAGMTTISPDGRWVRPLLGLERQRLRGWAEARGLEWREDATNLDRRFTRNRLRLDWLPGLASSFNPQLLRAVCSLADAQRRDLEWIEKLVEAAADDWIETTAPCQLRIRIDGWAALPEALAWRLARRAMIEIGLGRFLSRGHLERVLGFLRQGRATGRDKVVELPKGIRLRRVEDAFILGRPERGVRGEAVGTATLERQD